MKLMIENIGKIKNLEIDITGITVIAGENDTGKSTIGKSLYSIFASLYNIEKKMLEIRKNLIEEVIEKFEEEFFEKSLLLLYQNDEIPQNREILANELTGIIGKNENLAGIIEKKIEKYATEVIKVSERINFEESKKKELIRKAAKGIENVFEIKSETIKKAIMNRVFNKEFGENINNVFSEEEGVITIKAKGVETKLFFEDERITKVVNLVGFTTEAVYIENPFIINNWNKLEFVGIDNLTLSHEESLVRKLSSVKNTDISYELSTKEKLKDIFDKLNIICKGDIKMKNSTPVVEMKNSRKAVSLKNLSAGVKTFTILRELLLKGEISENDTIILDEPEIHLHPEWQIFFAELIVLLQIEFNLHILITTHSHYFLNAIEVYTAKHGSEEKCNYYMATKNNQEAIFEKVNGNTEKIYAKLAKPLQVLDNIGNEYDE